MRIAQPTDRHRHKQTDTDRLQWHNPLAVVFESEHLTWKGALNVLDYSGLLFKLHKTISHTLPLCGGRRGKVWFPTTRRAQASECEAAPRVCALHVTRCWRGSLEANFGRRPPSLAT